MLYVEADNAAARGAVREARLRLHRAHRLDRARRHGAPRSLTGAATRYDLGRDELADLLAGEPAYRVDQVWHGPVPAAAGAGRADRRCPRPSGPASPTRAAAGARRRVTRVGSATTARRSSGCGRWTTAPRSRPCSCTTPTGRPCASRPRPAAPWPAGSAPPARPGSSATSRRARSSSRSCGRRTAARPRRPAAVERRVHGHGRAAGQLRPRCGRPSSASTTTSASRPATSRSRRSGIVPGIRRLAAEDLPGQPRRLAARRQRRAARRARPDQPRATRSTRSPTPARSYLAAKNRRLSFEWALIDGVNDRAVRRRRAGRLRRPPLRRPREPHPAEPHARASPPRARRRHGCAAFRDRLDASRRQRHRPPEPGHRHRRRLRPAAGEPRGQPGRTDPSPSGPSVSVGARPHRAHQDLTGLDPHTGPHHRVRRPPPLDDRPVTDHAASAEGTGPDRGRADRRRTHPAKAAATEVGREVVVGLPQSTKGPSWRTASSAPPRDTGRQTTS